MTGMKQAIATRCDDDREELVGPTPEWRRHHRGAVVLDPQVDRRTRRVATKVQNVVETMRDRGEIPSDSYQAWLRWERDVVLARSEARVTARYGERAVPGQTPMSQLLPDALDRLDLYDDRKRMARQRLEALFAMMSPRMCEVLVALVDSTRSLRDVGHDFGVADRHAASSVAKAVLQEALWMMHKFYTQRHPPRQMAEP